MRKVMYGCYDLYTFMLLYLNACLVIIIFCLNCYVICYFYDNNNIFTNLIQ